MKQVHDAQINRYPGQIQQSQGAGAAEELLDLVEVLHRLYPQPALFGVRHRQQGHHGRRAQLVIQSLTDPGNHAAADQVDQPHECVQRHHQDDQPHQGRHRTAGQHPVIDLQHEQRPGQGQQIDDETEGDQCA